jgi:hypothetical protein
MSLRNFVPCSTPTTCIGIEVTLEALGYSAYPIHDGIYTDAPRDAIREARSMVEDSLDLEEVGDDD